MPRDIHDCTLAAQIRNGRVLELRTVENLYRNSLACVLTFEALSTPNDAKVAHAYHNIQSVGTLPHGPARIDLHRVASMSSRKFCPIVCRLYHHLF